MSFRRRDIPTARTCQTAGCGTVYLGGPRSRFCDGCKAQRVAKQKQTSQASHRGRGRPPEQEVLTEAEIDRRFTEALAQIRRERRFTADVGSSHNWKYQEPGGNR